MVAFAVLALVPHVVLLPPDASSDLQPLAETCAQAIASSASLQVTRIAPAALPSAGVADRARAELGAAAQSYRELSFADAKEQSERAIATLEQHASTDEDFELLVEARLRLAMTLLAQRKNAPAQRALEAAARIRPDAEVTEGDYPPNLVAAFDRARAAVQRTPRVPAAVTARSSVAGVEPTVWIDGRRIDPSAPGLVPGEHVVVAFAPGHRPVRQTIRVPLAAPLALALEPTAAVPAGIIMSLAIERTHGRLHLTLRRAAGADASRDVDMAAAPAVARELAETLAGVPRVVAANGTGGGAGAGTVDRVGSGRGTRPADPPRVPGGRENGGGGSIFGTWWFWTITGTVVTVGLVGLVAANSRDPGTNVRVGLAD